MITFIKEETYDWLTTIVQGDIDGAWQQTRDPRKRAQAALDTLLRLFDIQVILEPVDAS